MNKKQFDSLSQDERKRFLNNLPEGLTEHERTLYFKEKKCSENFIYTGLRIHL